MLSFIKKYVMQKIGYESSSKPISIEDIKVDYISSFRPINIEEMKIEHRLSLELINIMGPDVENRSAGDFSNSLQDIMNGKLAKQVHSLFTMDLRQKEYFPKNLEKEGPLLGNMDLRQQENFLKSLENVILFRTSKVRASYYSDCAVSRISTQMEEITRGSRDLVLLLLLIYSNIDDNIGLLENLIKDCSGSRVKMIEKIHLLGKEGKLSIESSECLGCIIKMSTFIEKQCRSNIVSVMDMVSSGDVDGLAQDVKARVKNLVDKSVGLGKNLGLGKGAGVGEGVGYNTHSPASSLQDLSVDTLVKHGLIK